MPEESGKTVVDVQQSLDRLRQWLKEARPVAWYEIEDYPIGRNARGRCKLEVEWAGKKGWRTVRTTTDKFGRWCKPHKSTFRDGLGVVVTHPDLTTEGRGAAWFVLSERSVYVQFANGETKILADAPHYMRPNREQQSYKVVTSEARLVLGGSGVHSGGEAPTRQETTHVVPADPPSLCDAYDLWLRCLQQLQTDLVQHLNALRKAV